LASRFPNCVEIQLKKQLVSFDNPTVNFGGLANAPSSLIFLAPFLTVIFNPLKDGLEPSLLQHEEPI
jgi:hypothetical protein